MRHPRRQIPIQPITFLWERHKSIARDVVAGERPVDLARKYSMTQSRVSIIMNSPAFKKYVAELRSRVEVGLADIRKTINKGAQKGVELMMDTLKGTGAVDDSTKFRVKLAQDFLDRDGHGKIQKVQSQSTHVILNAERIEQLKQRREDLMRRSAVALDITSSAVVQTN